MRKVRQRAEGIWDKEGDKEKIFTILSLCLQPPIQFR
jgi:hypothetical protein